VADRACVRGHRHGTHSIAGIAAFTGAAYLAEHYRRTLGGKIGLGLLLVLVLAAGLRALKIGGHFGDLLAIVGAFLMIRSGFGVAGVPWAIEVGTATHLAGDMLTQRGHTDRLALVPAAYQAAPRAIGIYHRDAPGALGCGTGNGGSTGLAGGGGGEGATSRPAAAALRPLARSPHRRRG
jgi:hypothetical protein